MMAAPERFTDSAHLEEYIVQRIRTAMPDTKAIYLFGSRAIGNARPDSDYDVAVLCGHSQSDGERFFRLQIELASLTESGVNLVDLRSAPIVMQFEVLRGRRRLFCAEQDFCAIFEAEIFSKYQRFEEERMPIIAAFLNRHLIHDFS